MVNRPLLNKSEAKKAVVYSRIEDLLVGGSADTSPKGVVTLVGELIDICGIEAVRANLKMLAAYEPTLRKRFPALYAPQKAKQKN